MKHRETKNLMSTPQSKLLCASLAALGLTFGSTAQAASSVYTGKASANWNNTTNWIGETLPGIGDDLVIADATTNNSITLNDGSHTIGTLQFGGAGLRANPPSAQFIINGNTSAATSFGLTITNGVVANGNFQSSGTAGFQTKVPITMQGDQTWSIGGNAGGGNADFGLMLTVGTAGVQRPLVLNGKLTKVGSGQLCFVGQNVGNGDIVVNQGSLKYNAGTTSMLTVGGTGSVTVNNGAALFISKNSGSLNITKAVVMNNGSTLRLAGNNATKNFVGCPFTFNGTVPIIGEYASLLLDFTNTLSGTINSTITGSAGILTFWANNSALSGTINNNAALLMRFGAASAASTAVNYGLNNAAAYYEIYGPVTDLAIGALSGNSGIVRNSNTNSAPATLSVGALNLSTTFGGVLADNTGAMALNKVGTGRLTLTNANTYSGATVVNGGGLFLQGTGASLGFGSVTVNAGASFGGNGSVNGPVTLSSGATLQLDGALTAPTLAITSLTLGAGGADQTVSRFNVYLGGKVTGGTLTVNGQNTIDILGSAPAVGVYDLFTYAGSIAGAGFAGFKMGALPYGVVAHLQDSGSAVQLNVTAVTVEPGIWTGAASSVWNLAGGLEWKGATSGNPQPYHDLDVVSFDDSATSFNVNITENVTPTTLTVNNNAQTYTFSGAGGITGSAALGKDGSGTLVLANANSYTSGTYITNGAVQIGNGGTNGSINGAILDNGSLLLNRSDVLTVSGDISGTGSVEQRGSGMSILSGNNSFAGAAKVTTGTLATGSGLALGDTNAATTVAAGATLDVNSQGLGMEPITVLGAGIGAAGAIVNNGPGDQQNALRYVTLTGPTTFGGFRRWDIRDPAPAADPTGGLNAFLLGNGHKLTKVGTNVVAFISIGETSLGDIDIQGGTLTISRSTFLGNASGKIAINPGATLQLHRLAEFAANVLNRVVLMTNATFGIEPNGLTNQISGPITVSGSNTIGLPAAAGMDIMGSMTGDGSITAGGGGALIISGTCSHTGGTTFSGGFLQVDGSLGTGALPLNLSGAVLSGNGTIRDAVTIPTGSTLAPGTTEPGALSINNSLVLAAGSTSRFKINKDMVTNDVVRGLSSVTYGGALVLTNTGSVAYAPGDSFKLFSASSYSGSFSSITPAIPALGLIWDTNALQTAGTLKVMVLPTPRPLVVLSAASLINQEVDVMFDTFVDLATAQDASNYSINSGNQIVGATVVNATNVVLTLDSPLTKSSFILQVRNVRDLSYIPNVVVTTNIAGIVVGFEQKGSSVITNGSAFAFADKIKMYSDGSDIFNTSDQFEFVYKQLTNDFDVSVRVESFTVTDPAAKAGIMAREITDATYIYPAERMAMSACFPPDPGRSQAFFQYREIADTAAAALAAPRPLVAFPDNWVRLQRVGAVFNTYCSSNNMDWSYIGSIDTATNASGPFTDVMRVGLAATSHNVALTTEVVFSKFGAPKNRVPLTITAANGGVDLSWPASGIGVTLQSTPSLSTPVVWSTVPGSTTTNLVHLPASAGSTYFRLVGE